MPVTDHYARPNLAGEILHALQAAGKDIDRLTLDDLAPMSEFHIQGRFSTEALARLAELRPGMRVLDVGCGIGGPARYLAANYGSDVTGVDLTPEYIEAAEALSEWTRMADRTHFVVADGSDLPFHRADFDLVWTQHCNMNISDKHALSRGLFRALKPGGAYAMHELFGESNADLAFPMPWASEPAISHLVSEQEAQSILKQVGFVVEEWQDVTAESHAWFSKTIERFDHQGVPALSLKLLMPEFRTMAGNLTTALGEGKLTVVMARMLKPA